VGSEERQPDTVELLMTLVSEITAIRRMLALHFDQEWALSKMSWRAKLRQRQHRQMVAHQVVAREEEPQRPDTPG